jgi:hypothetical protein
MNLPIVGTLDEGFLVLEISNKNGETIDFGRFHTNQALDGLIPFKIMVILLPGDINLLNGSELNIHIIGECLQLKVGPCNRFGECPNFFSKLGTPSSDIRAFRFTELFESSAMQSVKHQSSS